MSESRVFTSNVDIHKTAFLNWRMSERDVPENLCQMGKAFGEGAMALIEKCLDDNNGHEADALIFPILYGVDQCIEVMIKAILYCLDILEGSKGNVSKTHDVFQLLSQLKSAIKRHAKRTRGLEKHLEPVQTYLDELNLYIGVTTGQPHMDFARYPIDTDGNPYFYVVSRGNITVDLVVLKEKLQGIIDSLDALYCMCSVERDELYECLSMMESTEEDYGY